MRLDTIDPADTVEFCPHPDASGILVCGTYNLLKPDDPNQPYEGTQKRIGSVLVFEKREDNQLYECNRCLISLNTDLWGMQIANTGDPSTRCP